MRSTIVIWCIEISYSVVIRCIEIRDPSWTHPSTPPHLHLISTSLVAVVHAPCATHMTHAATPPESPMAWPHLVRTSTKYECTPFYYLCRTWYMVRVHGTLRHHTHTYITVLLM